MERTWTRAPAGRHSARVSMAACSALPQVVTLYKLDAPLRLHTSFPPSSRTTSVGRVACAQMRLACAAALLLPPTISAPDTETNCFWGNPPRRYSELTMKLVPWPNEYDGCSPQKNHDGQLAL